MSPSKCKLYFNEQKNHLDKFYNIEFMSAKFATRKNTPDRYTVTKLYISYCLRYWNQFEIFEAIFKVKFQNTRLAENPVRVYMYKNIIRRTYHFWKITVLNWEAMHWNIIKVSDE